MRKIFILLTSMLLLAHLSWADSIWTDSVQTFDIKALKKEGKISSLEYILNELSDYNINRLLEIELKRRAAQDEDFQHGVVQQSPGRLRHQFIYEIEYINDKGMVLEIEVDALTAEVLKHVREY